MARVDLRAIGMSLRAPPTQMDKGVTISTATHFEQSSSWREQPLQLTFQYGDDLITVDVDADGDQWLVRLPDGSTHRIAATRLPGDVLQISEGDRTFRIPFARSARGLEISHCGSTYAFTTASASRKPGGARKSAGSLASPMGGVVAEVLVVEGQSVDAYAPLVVVEAMKVYATVEATFAGTVKAISVKKGDRVEMGQTLVDLEKGNVDG